MAGRLFIDTSAYNALEEADDVNHRKRGRLRSARGGQPGKNVRHTMATVKHDRKRLPKGKTDWKALDRLSDEELEHRALSDPDARPLNEKDLKGLRCSPRVRIFRMSLGLTQEEFAAAYGIPVATLGDWEQGRREPDQASKTLLTLIERMPHEVRKALAADKKRSGKIRAPARPRALKR